jgi:hypothetical protein
MHIGRDPVERDNEAQLHAPGGTDFWFNHFTRTNPLSLMTSQSGNLAVLKAIRSPHDGV